MTLPASNLRSIHGETSRRPVLQAVLAIFSFEFVFVLFLFSGQYKADPRFDWIPYDATVFWGLVNVLQGILLVIHPRFKINRAGLPVLLFTGIFAGYVVLSTTWCAGVTYATYKAAYISTICVWCLCAGALFISSNSVRLIRFFRILVLFTGWIAIECLLFYVQNSQIGTVIQVYAMAGEGAYIGLGRAISSGGLVCAVMWLFGSLPRWGLWQSRVATLFALTFFVASAAITGARGPIVAAVLAIVLVCLVLSQVSLARKFKRIGAVLLVVVVFASAYHLVTGEIPLALKRFLAFSDASQYYDVSGQIYSRLDLFAEAFWAWWERPVFGHGIGSFPIIWESIDERLFPHNLVLELLSELGLVGLLLFAAIPAMAFTNQRHKFRSVGMSTKALVIAFAAYTFANTMTSGDIPDNRIIFFALGLLCFRQTEGGKQLHRNLALRNRPPFPKVVPRVQGLTTTKQRGCI